MAAGRRNRSDAAVIPAGRSLTGGTPLLSSPGRSIQASVRASAEVAKLQSGRARAELAATEFAVIEQVQIAYYLHRLYEQAIAARPSCMHSWPTSCASSFATGKLNSRPSPHLPKHFRHGVKKSAGRRIQRS
jgi:hypothetical protein